MKASDLFIRCLEREGVEYIFGIPGEETLDFLESLSNSTIQLVLTRHEQVAAMNPAACSWRLYKGLAGTRGFFEKNDRFQKGWTGKKQSGRRRSYPHRPPTPPGIR
ncbi:MAG: thiamine pyrophosphate-binding protein, partial [Nitrospinaceae bacterium]